MDSFRHKNSHLHCNQCLHEKFQFWNNWQIRTVTVSCLVALLWYRIRLDVVCSGSEGSHHLPYNLFIVIVYCIRLCCLQLMTWSPGTPSSVIQSIAFFTRIQPLFWRWSLKNILTRYWIIYVIVGLTWTFLAVNFQPNVVNVWFSLHEKEVSGIFGNTTCLSPHSQRGEMWN